MPIQPRDQRARAALSRTNQQLLTEIGQLAQYAEQSEPDQSLKQMARQIATVTSQARLNAETQHQV